VFLDFLFKRNECPHDEITPEMKEGYCPDCGEYIQNHWFISRCSCCGLKQRTTIIKGKISSQNKFCRNCGSNSFYVEKLDKINVIDVNYAAVIKQAVRTDRKSFIQCWVEPERFVQLKLLTG